MKKLLTLVLIAIFLSTLALPAFTAEELTLPIVQEPIELRFFASLWNTHSPWNEMLVWQEYAKRTNMNVYWETAPADGFREKRNLSLAAEKLPDAYWASGFTASELAIYGAEGLFIPLEDLIDKYMPNLSKIMADDPTVRKAIMMPDGHIYSLPNLFEENAPLKAGLKLFIQPTWLENLGLEMPKTTEEFYNVLVAFKEKDADGDGDPNNEIPFGTASSALLDGLVNTFAGSFGIMNRGASHPNVDVDPETKELRFFRISEGYRKEMEWLHKMYSEGLIEPEVFTIDAATRVAKGSTGIYGALNSITGGVVRLEGSYVGVPVLTGPDGFKSFNNLTSAVSSIGGFVITVDNQYPVETAKWMDYFYSDEGMKLLFMGVEGITFNYVDGKPVLVDDITNNPDGLTLDSALARYSPRPGGSYTSIVSTKYFSGYETREDAIAAAYMMEPDFIPIEDRWPGFTFTIEEAEELRAFDDLLTYVSTMKTKFVKGDEPLSNWDQYVAQVEQMGVAKYLEIYQNARERVNAE